MKVLVVHNYYRVQGGECVSFEAEADGLRELGCEVETLSLNSGNLGFWDRLSLPLQQIWSLRGANLFADKVKSFNPDIVHFQNLFPLLSRSCAWKGKELGVPMVHTLRNYRYLCANALLEREGAACELCIETNSSLPALRYKCYRNSALATIPLVLGNVLHNSIGSNKIDNLYYITASEFARSRFLNAGWDKNKFFLKPNLIKRRAVNQKVDRKGLLYVGRLSEEKGIKQLLAAWKISKTQTSLTIIGDGPLAKLAEEAASSDTRISYLGRKSADCVIQSMADAKALVQPSLCYETFGRTLAEALSVGTPVIASNHGALREIVELSDGILITPLDVNGFSQTLDGFFSLSNEKHFSMSQSAFKAYEENFKFDMINNQLLNILKEIVSRDMIDA